MLAGYIKPLVVRIIHPSRKYSALDLLDKNLPVIGYDTKYLVVADSRFLRCVRVPWEDIMLVESERIIQSFASNRTIDNSKTVVNKKRYESLFHTKKKSESRKP